MCTSHSDEESDKMYDSFENEAMVWKEIRASSQTHTAQTVDSV